MTEELKFGVQVIQFICMFGLALYTFLSNRSAARLTEVQLVNDRVLTLEKSAATKDKTHEIDLRLSQAEERLNHLAEDGQLKKLEGDIGVINSQIEGLNKLLQPMQRTLDNINQYLLNNKP